MTSAEWFRIYGPAAGRIAHNLHVLEFIVIPLAAPSGTVVMTSLAARHSEGDLGEMPNDLLAQQVEAENAGILGITGEPIDRMMWEYFHALLRGPCAKD